MPKAKGGERHYQEIVDLSKANPDEIKSAFEKNVSDQEAHHAVLSHTMDTYSVNIFQNIYLNEIQPSLMDCYHSHSYYEINYVYSGTCYQYLAGTLLAMHAGDYLIMSPDVKHACYLSPDGLARNVLIRKSEFEKVAAELAAVSRDNYLTALQKDSCYYLFHGAPHRIIPALFEELYDYSYAILKPYTVPTASVEKLLSLLLWETQNLLEKDALAYESNRKKKKRKPVADFEAITQFIKENIATVKRTDVEEQFGYSSMSLCRIMKRNGTTFRKYLHTVRLQQAINLLKNTNRSIQDIAKMLGFSSGENFCHFFVKERGMSPGEYRKAYRRSGLVDGTGDHGNYFF